MNRVGPLLGLLLTGVLLGGLMTLPTNQILVPFIIQQRIVYNPASYLNNMTLYAGETGSVTLPNIMQAAIYTNSALIAASTRVFNTALAFRSLNFTLHFGSMTLVLNGLENVTSTITLSQGLYPVSLTIEYTTVTMVTEPVTGYAAIILSTN